MVALYCKVKDVSSLQDVIAALIQERQHVSFPELIRHLEALGVEARGEWAVTTGLNTNAILWPGVSEVVLNALKRLISCRRLHLHVCHPSIYSIDGEVPTLPLIESGREAFDVWLPVVLCTFPYKPRASA